MKRRSITALLGVSCLALVLVSGPKASAQAECPYLYTECPVLVSVAVDPFGFPTNQFAPGEQFGLVGFNFAENTDYTITFEQNPTIDLVSTIRTGPANDFAAGEFVVFSEIPEVAAEEQGATLIARPADSDSGLPVATLGVFITDDPFRPQADDDPDDDNGGTTDGGGGDTTNGTGDDTDDVAADDEAKLPATGTDIAVFGAYGAILLAAGWALVAYARRRRPAPSPDLDAAYRVPDLLPADWSKPLTKA